MDGATKQRCGDSRKGHLHAAQPCSWAQQLQHFKPCLYDAMSATHPTSCFASQELHTLDAARTKDREPGASSVAVTSEDEEHAPLLHPAADYRTPQLQHDPATHHQQLNHGQQQPSTASQLTNQLFCHQEPHDLPDNSVQTQSESLPQQDRVPLDCATGNPHQHPSRTGAGLVVAAICNLGCERPDGKVLFQDLSLEVHSGAASTLNCPVSKSSH